MGERRQQRDLTEVTDRAIETGHTYWYRLLAIGANGAQTVFGPIRADVAAVKKFALGAPAPNPAAGPVRFEFSVATQAPVRLSVVDITGREVAVLSQGTLSPGHYLAVWDRKSTSGRIPAGLYFVRLTAEGRILRGRFVVLD